MPTFEVTKCQTFEVTKCQTFKVTRCLALLDSHFECCWLELVPYGWAVGCGCSLVHDKTLVHSAPGLRCLAVSSCIPTVADLERRQSSFATRWGKTEVKTECFRLSFAMYVGRTLGVFLVSHVNVHFGQLCHVDVRPYWTCEADLALKRINTQGS